MTRAQHPALPRRLAAAAAAALAVVALLGLAGGTVRAGARPGPQPQAEEPVSAVGVARLSEVQQVVFQSNGIITSVAVKTGDGVDSGALLVAIDPAPLRRAMQRAEISLEQARLQLKELTKAAEESDVAVAEANLLLAQERLELVEAGPTADELKAVENAAAAAWAGYEELKAGPTAAEMAQVKADLARAEVDLQEAQRAYDKIAWMPEAAAMAEASTLQRATIAYESAKAAFDEASKPATQAELLTALSAAQAAQDALNELKKRPTPAELADARANLAAAQAALDQLKKGATETELAAAELGVQSALLDLEEARLNLAHAQVTAPISGTLLSLDAEPGQMASAGTVVATMADPTALELVASVEQVDIDRVRQGQPVEVSFYALDGRVFSGTVIRISPQGTSETGTVTFPVIIQLASDRLEGVRPGMTASAKFMENEQ